MSRQGGWGRPGRLGFLFRSDIAPPPASLWRVGRPHPFVSRLAYLHVNAAPVPALLEMAPAILGTGSVRELFFYSDPWGHYCSLGGGGGVLDDNLAGCSPAAREPLSFQPGDLGARNRDPP